MAAPAFVRIAGTPVNLGNASPSAFTLGGQTAGNLLVLVYSQARREGGTPAAVTYTTPSGWTTIGDQYYELPDLLRSGQVHWASTFACATIATAGMSAPTVVHTGTGGSFAYGQIYEYDPAKVVGFETDFGLLSNPTASTTYAAGAASSLIWNIASSNDVGVSTQFTTTSANSFTNDADNGNSLYKGKFMHRDGVAGTTNLPTVDDASALSIYNWYPWVSLGVELAAVPVGWVRGHAWG
jgi:hypothetical protein